ncbi:uncharacterized protein [Venturia canescens]|uniref:uncharacterized protein n=1 Tax=Venturia canescens TaxID=32260 RepID=UPI001C9C143C|nr:uncharacterized protein LOC122415271 [Venturia canescens]
MIGDSDNCSMSRANKSSSDKNTNWKGDFEEALRYTRWLLRILGIWHLVATKSMKIEKYLSRVIVPLVLLAMISLTLPIYSHVITRPIDHLELIVLLGPIVAQTANIFMYLTTIMRSDTIRACIRHIEIDWKRIENSTERRIMRRHARFSHTLTIACIIFMYTAALCYSLIMPLMAGNTINEFNETLRPLPVPGTDIFIDAQANVIYEIVFAMNFISALFHDTVITAVCHLAIILVSHACGQIQVIIWNLENNFQHSASAAEKKPLRRFMTERIRFIVLRHVRLLKFVENIEKALKEIFLIEVVSSTLIMCFIEYDIIIALEHTSVDRLEMISYVMLLASFTFNLFLYCQFGEVLNSQCQRVGTIAYMIDWYKLPNRIQLDFIMIMNTARYPCKLTAGGIMELSIANFASISKTSVAFLNMMRTMG